CDGYQYQIGLLVILAKAGQKGLTVWTAASRPQGEVQSTESIQFLQRLSGCRIRSGMTQSNKWDSSGSEPFKNRRWRRWE
ncbi:MAG: hypothetical protein RQ867_06455, partial [Mariprofundaceae bacterium]|nr:hypothetical protein [Mariprofundaceae bacterium]